MQRERLKLGYKKSPDNIPTELRPLLKDTAMTYRLYHPDLNSVYLFGSAALGEWSRGISDIDVLGVTRSAPPIAADRMRREAMVELGEKIDLVTFIDNSVIDLGALNAPMRTREANGRVFQLATSGVCIWGEELADLEQELPTVRETAYSRTERVVLLMKKYRSGNIIESFRRDTRLLSRSSAKAAMRVLSGATILRDAPFFPSPVRTAEMVDVYVPEAVTLKDKAMDIIKHPQTAPEPEEAMRIADTSVDLFYNLFPADMPRTRPQEVISSYQ